MSYPSYPIVGIPLDPDKGKPLPVRQEITAWYKEPDNTYQVSLLIQALVHMQSQPVEDMLSYFQLAGIHSYPMAGWDGVPGVPGKAGTSQFPGFCAHNMVTFPTWHRPYMLLYEQVLHANMMTLIKGWEKSIPNLESGWRLAATQFRLPYWDWARKQTYGDGKWGLPYLCTLEKIQVLKPGGGTLEFLNPLAIFQNSKQDGFGKPVAFGDPSMGIYAVPDDTSDPKETLPWSQCKGTSRHGIVLGGDWAMGINNWDGVNKALSGPNWYGQGSGFLPDAINRMFSPRYFGSWDSFASTIYNNPDKATHFYSLEYIHNVIHNSTGGIFMKADDVDENSKGYTGLGIGHMSDPPVAAFDPIFWFHHCNIDRLLAIWQALNTSMWFSTTPRKSGDPTSETNLLPFHKDTNQTFWNSDKCRDWTRMNYQYDDLVPQSDAINKDGSIKQNIYLAELRTHLNELYPSTSQIVRTIPGLADEENKFNDYIINVVYDRYAIRGRSYAILFFIGLPPKDLATYKDHENYVGIVYTFSAPFEAPGGRVTCANCAQQSEKKVLSKAHIPITLHLIARALPPPSGSEPQLMLPSGGLEKGGLPPTDVETVLEKDLKWVFVEIGGRTRDAADFPDTEIAVMHGKGTHNLESHQLPSYAGYKKLLGATKKKLLGSGYDDSRPSLIQDDD